LRFWTIITSGRQVVLPRNEMSEKEESIVFGYLHDSNYDPTFPGTLVESASDISEERLSEATRAYITEYTHHGNIYTISLTAMRLQVGLCIEKILFASGRQFLRKELPDDHKGFGWREAAGKPLY
jgi:hypothetical protein